MPKKISKKGSSTHDKKTKAVKTETKGDEIIGIKEPLEEGVLDEEVAVAETVDPEVLEAALDDEEFVTDMDSDDQW